MRAKILTLQIKGDFLGNFNDATWCKKKKQRAISNLNGANIYCLMFIIRYNLYLSNPAVKVENVALGLIIPHGGLVVDLQRHQVYINIIR